MTRFDRTRTACLFALACSLTVSSCQLLSSLGKGQVEDIPYGKETQLAYFEGQGHLLKGDFEDAYASFLKCADAEPAEMAFHFQLGKIDLELERFEAAENHGNGETRFSRNSKYQKLETGEWKWKVLQV